MSISKYGVVGVMTRFAAKLRFPYLFFLFMVLLVVDVIVPDPFPFADEIVFAMGTLLFARLRKPETVQRQGQSEK
jgi:hypothetical protein